MLSVTGKYVYVFQPVLRLNVSERIVFANLSTFKKDTCFDENGYPLFDNEGNKVQKKFYMHWPAKFVGDAFEAAKSLRDKDCINILNGVIENIYNKEKKTYYVTVVVFEFEFVTSEPKEKEQEVRDASTFNMRDIYKTDEDYFMS